VKLSISELIPSQAPTTHQKQAGPVRKALKIHGKITCAYPRGYYAYSPGHSLIYAMEREYIFMRKMGP
jgi:hypothetical protein